VAQERLLRKVVAKRQLQATGETQENVDQRILEAIAEFVDRFTGR